MNHDDYENFRGTQKEIAKSLGISTQQVSGLKREGMPIASDGKGHVAACHRWYAERFKKSKSSIDEELSRARVKKIKVETKKLDLEVKIMQGKLLRVVDVHSQLSVFLCELHNEMKMIGAKNCTSFSQEENSVNIRNVIDREVQLSINRAIARVNHEYGAKTK